MPDLEDHLDDALNALLAVRIELGLGRGVPVPAQALDAVLAADDDYQGVKARLMDAVAQGDVLEGESAVHHLVAVVTDRIWAVASTSITTWRKP